MGARRKRRDDLGRVLSEIRARHEDEYSDTQPNELNAQYITEKILQTSPYSSHPLNIPCQSPLDLTLHYFPKQKL
jgi:hypothetical protein